MDAQLDRLKLDSNGLIPAIIQDHKTGEVLAMFWMNREAIEKTIATGKVHSYSRSRGRLALKGETSGHFEHVKAVLTDCDRDAPRRLLLVLLQRVSKRRGRVEERRQKDVRPGQGLHQVK
jgi:phosphoribosyl-AMP cyclohydrolase